MIKPLTGTLVVSLDQAVAAPMTARRLADAGARVIKLERPEGDFARYYDNVVHGQCTHYVWLNRGKESVVADLTKPEDRRLFEAMLAKADVLSPEPQARRTGQARLSLRAALRERYPRAHLLLDLGLRRRGPLSRPQGLRPADPGRIGACLHHRRTRGAGARRRIPGRHRHRHARLRSDPGGADRARAHRQGRRHPRLDVRRDDGVDGDPDAATGEYGEAPKRWGSRIPRVGPYGVFDTADGVPILISVQNDREWAVFCNKVLGRPELATRSALRHQSGAHCQPNGDRRVGRTLFRRRDVATLSRQLEAARDRLRARQRCRRTSCGIRTCGA